MLIVLAGCMTMSAPPPSATALRPIEPPSVAAPLGAQEDHEVRRPAPPPKTDAVPPRKQKAIPLPKIDPDEEPAPAPETDSDAPPPRPIVPPTPGIEFDHEAGGPRLESTPGIEPAEVTASEPLELKVSAPARRQLGGVATYHVVLHNAGDSPQEGLVVRCRFDDALKFLGGSSEREMLRRIERLAPGETKELALSLSSRAIGSHCCWFVLTRREAAADVEVVAHQVCVDFVTRHVEVDLLGPTQRTEGSRAEFNITLANRSSRAIDDVQATVAFDKALVLKEASAEAERKPGSLVWRLGRLEADETVQLQVEFECRTQAHRACLAVDVKSAGLPAEHEEACVEIIPVPGTLDLRIGDRNDPIVAGQTGAYDVTVQNIGLQPARRVVLTTVIPDSVKVRSVSVQSGAEELPLKHAADGNKLVFDAVDQIAPNAKVTYTFEVEALRAGPAEFRASLTSSLSSTPVTASEPTTIEEP